ncbi:MAG: Farnesyl diphosphate synthase [Firmicutes bacterium ADurb.Bin182]|nr:MAG: Farnesyl diphosphate synthase [Firmicutes bacterium ADurb.Bin182]
MDFLSKMKEYRDSVENSLKIYIENPLIPVSLSEAMAYSLFAGGKRLRPCMTLSACDLVGGNISAALPIACAVEMIHTYSLIHDDLPCMDNDDFRRGRPSNHIAFGEGKAVLAGDGLFSYAFQVMLQAEKEWGSLIPTYTEAIRAVADGAGVWGMVAGQAMDLESENDQCAGEKELFYIHSHKTGAMLKASVLAGAAMKRIDKEALSSLSSFGEYFGLLFQITDDILDETAGSKELGKTAGKDSASGKLTYVKIYGLGKARMKAAEAASEAKAYLSVFGGKARFFNELVDFVLNREG